MTTQNFVYQIVSGLLGRDLVRIPLQGSLSFYGVEPHLEALEDIFEKQHGISVFLGDCLTFQDLVLEVHDFLTDSDEDDDEYDSVDEFDEDLDSGMDEGEIVEEYDLDLSDFTEFFGEVDLQTPDL